jgi:hypothetical protein
MLGIFILPDILLKIWGKMLEKIGKNPSLFFLRMLKYFGQFWDFILPKNIIKVENNFISAQTFCALLKNPDALKFLAFWDFYAAQ